MNLIEWLQNWYEKYCDGDWEHDEHFVIRNIDNPGWRVTINLVGTNCENKPFTNIEIENSEVDWYHSRLCTFLKHDFCKLLTFYDLPLFRMA